MLLNAKRHWPDMITNMLWPFALKMTADWLNTFMENNEGLSPNEVLSGIWAELDSRGFQVFGCPVFVLDHCLQNGIEGILKWDPRARVGIYLGESPYHAGNVALVLNPRTGHVSPQYHMVFDDDFNTVPHMLAGTVPQHLEKLVRLSSECATYEYYKISDEWTKPQDSTGTDAGDFTSGKISHSKDVSES